VDVTDAAPARGAARGARAWPAAHEPARHPLPLL